MSIEEKKHSGWQDDVMKGIDYVHNLLDFVRRERFQLYGMLIHLFKTYGITKLELPSVAVLSSYGVDYYLIFHADESDPNKFVLELKEQTHDQEKILD